MVLAPFGANFTCHRYDLYPNTSYCDQIAEEGDEDSSHPPVIHVNLDVKLLLLLREIHYLSQEPFNIKLTGQARELLRNTSSEELRVTATRLETTVSKYSTVMRTMTSYEQPLFERLLAKIDHVSLKSVGSLCPSPTGLPVLPGSPRSMDRGEPGSTGG